MDISRDRFQLRKAADNYWLLDMTQKGRPYVMPIPVNESGALIWSMWQQGMSKEDIAEELGKRYGVSSEEIKDDVVEFFESISDAGGR